MIQTRRFALACLSVLLLGALAGCCGDGGCIKDPPCKTAPCGCAK